MNALILPMVAFGLNGYNEYIHLSIDEVFGYPNETSYGGGYGAKGTIEISVGGYNVNSCHYFTTGELYSFKESLNNCYNSILGEALLENTEHELQLSVSFNKLGKVKVTGVFQERPERENRLFFELNCDQTCILPVIRELESVEKIFGGLKGIKDR
jgi:hypothetical protein